MGHKVNRTRATNDFSASPFNTPTSRSGGLPETNLPTVHPWSLFDNSPQNIIRRILCVLPTQAQIQLLLRFYVRWNSSFLAYRLISWQVQQVDWYAKVSYECWGLGASSENFIQVIHVPTFMTEVSWQHTLKHLRDHKSPLFSRQISYLHISINIVITWSTSVSLGFY